MLSALPLIYCPPGVRVPDLDRARATVQCLPGAGPVGAPPGGMLIGGVRLPASGTWHPSPAGWWLHLDGHQPQHLLRLDPHPRILRWRWIHGVHPGHRWRVPVLLTDDASGQALIAAIDRVWGPLGTARGLGWHGGDLAELIDRTLALAAGLGEVEPETRADIVRSTVVELLAIGHVVDEDLIAAAGWLSERMLVATLLAACDREQAPHAATEEPAP